MSAAVETPLGNALRAHRDSHPGCRGCPAYIEIVRGATEQRIVWEGPTMAHTRLSVQEATV